jgi:hypothetical protein
MRNAYKILVVKLGGKKAFATFRSRWILKKQVVRVWTGFKWIRIERSGWLL